MCNRHRWFSSTELFIRDSNRVVFWNTHWRNFAELVNMQNQTDDNKKTEEKNKQQEQSSEACECKQEIIDLKAQLGDATNRWKRALADYQNLEKRIADERHSFVQFAAKNFIVKLLGIVDDLEKAHTHLKDQGLELALKKLNQVLKEEGVERIQVVGKKYDVATMEALTVVEGKADDIVIEEFRAGYTMHGSMLRAAQVKVSKKSKNL